MRILTGLLFGLVASCSATSSFFTQEQQHAWEQIHNELPAAANRIRELMKPAHKISTLSLKQEHFSPFGAATANAAGGGTLSASCVSAIATVKTNANTCGLAIFPQGTDVPTTPVPTTSGGSTLSPFQLAAYEVNQLCNSASCITTLQSSIKLAANACVGQVSIDLQMAAELAAFRRLNEFIAVGCNKDTVTGQYCLAEFFNNAASFSASTTLSNGANPFSASGTIDINVLNNLCTPCTLSTAAALSAINGGDAVDVAFSLNLLCLKDPTSTTGDYCVNTVISTVTSDKTSGTGGFTGAFCSPCFRRLLDMTVAQATITASVNGGGGAAVLVGGFTQGVMDGYLNALCSINPVNNKRCIDVFASFKSADAFSGEATCGVDFAQHTCGDQCKTAITTSFAPFGCCLVTVLNAVSGVIATSFTTPTGSGLPTSAITTASSPTTTGVSILSGLSPILNQCGLGYLLQACPAASNIIKFSLGIPNFSHAYYLSNTQSVNTALALDIAAHSWVSTAQVSITVTANTAKSTTNPGITVTATISASSNFDANIAQTSLNAQLQAQTSFSLPSLNSISSQNPSSVVDASQPMTAGDGTSSNVASNGGGGDGSHIQMSLFVLFLGAIITLIATRRQ